ncbi:MAG: hypothetical protein GEU28_03190, partial [Dehalococcoidia bacterium]|nr:hypothetical protein [Dehalococcoidia bacterium]
ADESLAGDVASLFDDFSRHALALTGQWVREVPRPQTPADLADYVAPRLSAPNETKQKLLEAASVAQQLEQERDLLNEEIPALRDRLRSQNAQRWWGLGAIN